MSQSPNSSPQIHLSPANKPQFVSSGVARRSRPVFAENGRKKKSGGAIGMRDSLRTKRNKPNRHISHKKRKKSESESSPKIDLTEDSLENVSVINSSSASIEEAIHSTPSINDSSIGDVPNGVSDGIAHSTFSNSDNSSIELVSERSIRQSPTHDHDSIEEPIREIIEHSIEQPLINEVIEDPIEEEPTDQKPGGEKLVGGKSSIIYSQVESESDRHYKQLIRYLSKVNGSANTLSGLIRQLGFNLDSSKLLERLEHYVVSPIHKIESPNEMPLRHLALASTEPGPHKQYNTVYDDFRDVSTTAVSRDDEAFLMHLWKLKHPKIEASEFNAELYDGPWIELVNATSRELVTYIILHCDVFRFNEVTGAWLCLGRSFNLSPYYKFQSANRNVNSRQDIAPYIDKRDIMYHRRGKNEHEFFAPSIEELMKQPLCGALRQHIASVIHHLNRYTKLALTDRARNPRYEHYKPNKYSEVARFVSSVIRKLIPRGLIGSQGNFAGFEHQLKEFLPHRGKTDIKPLIKGIKPSEIPWLKEINHESDSRIQLEFCVMFLYRVVKHILQLHYYITEVSGEPSSQVFYYVQNMWNNKMEGSATHEFLKTNCESPNRAPLDSASPKKNVVNWRFVPKKDGSLRPIINLKPLNSGFEVPHLILNYHVDNTEVSESFVRVKSWHAWALKLTQFRNNRLAVNPDKEFFLVKADIASCYDNAKRPPVKNIVSSTVQNGDTSYLVSNRVKLDTHKQRLRTSKVARTLEPDLPSSLKHSDDRRLQLEFERAPYKIHGGDKVIEAVDTIFNEIYLRTGKDYSVKFSAGIPQGSACSLDLCNMMLDDLISRKLSKYIGSENSILVRYVDDFLLVTTDRELACEFASDMTEGFPEYGVKSNPDKIVNTAALQPISDGESKDNKLVFLGTGIEHPSLKLVPLPIESVDPDFIARGDKAAVQRRLSSDMDRLISILRAFRRSNSIETPRYLEARVAKNVGKALASRMKAFIKIYEAKNPQAAFYQALNEYLLPNVANKSRRFVKRVAFETYSETLNKIDCSKRTKEHGNM